MPKTKDKSNNKCRKCASFSRTLLDVTIDYRYPCTVSDLPIIGYSHPYTAWCTTYLGIFWVRFHFFLREVADLERLADLGQLEGHQVHVVGQHLQLVPLKRNWWKCNKLFFYFSRIGKCLEKLAKYVALKILYRDKNQLTWSQCIVFIFL
jgi:hypothetical protein